MHFLEIGTDNDHVHFLVQAVPVYSSTEIITLIKSITAREVFRHHPEVKEQLILNRYLQLFQLIHMLFFVKKKEICFYGIFVHFKKFF